MKPKFKKGDVVVRYREWFYTNYKMFTAPKIFTIVSSQECRNVFNMTTDEQKHTYVYFPFNGNGTYEDDLRLATKLEKALK